MPLQHGSAKPYIGGWARREEGTLSVVVTGAAGFIGAHLVRELVRRGHRVVGIDRRDIIPAEATPLVAELSGGCRDVREGLAGADAVFHLAGAPGVRTADPEASERRRRDNVLAGLAVLRAVPAATTLVVVSSSSVYGGALHGGRVRASVEDDPLRPRGGYARSKAQLEAACWERLARGGAVAVARPFTVAGEGQREDMAIARWLAAARRGAPLTIYGSPARTRDVTDVRDVVEGLIRLADRQVSGPVNLGTGSGVPLLELAAAAARAAGVEPVIAVRPAGADDPPATLADTARCRRLLGFRPRTDLGALVARQAAAGSRTELGVAA